MTYGWAILIVIIVAAALYALGVFNPATYAGSRATGFANIGAPATGNWKLNTSATDNFELNLKNNLASRLNFTAVTVTIGATSCNNPDFNGAAYVEAGIGGTFKVEADCPGFTSGNTYTASVSLTYDNLDSGLKGFTETGTVTGTVS
ncbi:MAG: hypothetical protein GTN37_00790 [Candidatus Aenigmarchaeota archaeon]|nr:hypothetical protein [Candidatus Aenigmarchaeota archaeon]NIQ18192.1 hypothetical protein [Candidatus Aenigmarchaeota archaeon]NIS72949.1 hypothetical protein [Candidatus Aenigmarchaeota archaeon]